MKRRSIHPGLLIAAVFAFLILLDVAFLIIAGSNPPDLLVGTGGAEDVQEEGTAPEAPGNPAGATLK